MIRQDETDLTSEQYEAVKDSEGLFASQVIARRRNLIFEDYSTGMPASSEQNFDARIVGNELWRVHYQHMAAWFSKLPLSGEPVWQSKFIGSTLFRDCRPSMAPDGSFFATQSKNVLHFTTPDNGQTWSSQLIITDSMVDGLITGIACALGGIFIAVYRTDKNTRFYFAHPDRNWALEDSGIYWPFKTAGIAAEEIGDSAILVFATDFPPVLTKKPRGTITYTAAIRRQGLVAFRYHNGRWSDHFDVEMLDDASDYQRRANPFLTRFAGEKGEQRLVLSVFARDGRASNYHSGLNYYFSENGIDWEQPWIADNEGSLAGAKILPAGEYTYLVMRHKLLRSHTTELTGIPAPEIQLDITDRIVGWDTSAAPMRTSSYTLRNDNNWIADTMLAERDSFSLLVKLGVWHEGQKALVEFARELVDVIQRPQRTPTDIIQITARDYSSLLSTAIRSATARMVDTQMQGADRYVDLTGTGYGGLSHTAAQEGSWGAAEGWLTLRSNNARGVASTTFKSDIWNGTISAGIVISEQGPNQMAGLIFRNYDKDNYYSVEWVESANAIVLRETLFGETKDLKSVPATEWANNTLRYLRVTYRYSHVTVEHSADGHTWSLLFTHVVEGFPYSSDVGPVRKLSDGRAGFTGIGYSALDTWTPQPPPFSWELPKPEFHWHLPSDPSVIGLVNKDGYFYYTYNWDSDMPIWNRWQMGVDSPIHGYAFDAFAVENGQAFWVVTTGVRNSSTEKGRIYRVTNPFSEALRACAQQYAGFGWPMQAGRSSSVLAGRVMDASFSEPGFVVCATHYQNNGTYITRTLDGETWSEEFQITPHIETSADFDLHPALQITSKGPGEVYIGALQSSGALDTAVGALYKSSYGAPPYTKVTNLDIDFGLSCGEGVDFPFTGNPDNAVFYYTSRKSRDTFYNRYKMFRTDGSSKADITPMIEGVSFGRPLPRGGLVTCLSDPSVVLAVLAGEEFGPGYLWNRYAVFASANQGNDWRVIVPPGTDFRRCAISGADGREFYLFGANGAVSYSPDGGDTLIDKRGDLLTKFGSVGEFIAILGG